MGSFYYSVMQGVSNIAWGWGLTIMLFITHIFCTFRTGFIQRHAITKGIKLSFAKDEGAEGEISHFGALTSSLAAIVGLGNITGVATAVALGGPGAVFWCWLTGVLGMATKYSESLIAMKFRVKGEDGRMQGGTMYAIERGLNMKFLAVLFAVFTSVAAFGTGGGRQANSVADICSEYFSMSPLVASTICAVITGFILFGDIKRVARVCEKLVPSMIIFYLAGCAIILCMNIRYIAPALATIVRLAFAPGAAAGGIVGGGLQLAMQYGVARGLFSNESGLGSTPAVSAAARSKNPVRQALVASSSTFWDTVIICFTTGLVLVSTMLKFPELNLGEIRSGALLARAAFAQIPFIGTPVLAISMLTFAYTTYLGWMYYGARSAEYIFGKKSVVVYRLLYLALSFTSSVVDIDILMIPAESFHAFMSLPNTVAIFLLSPLIVKETKKYINDIDAEDPTPIPTVQVGVLRRKRPRAYSPVV